MRLIDAKDFERRIMETLTEEEICDDCLREFLSCMDTQPTIEAEPEKHGKWTKGFYNSESGMYVYTCTNCMYGCNHSHRKEPIWGYCPNCGAKMDLED